MRGIREITIAHRHAIGSYECTFRAARVVFRISPTGRAREGDSGRRYLSARGISKRGWERRRGRERERERERRASGRLRPHAQSPPKPQRERFVVPPRESKKEGGNVGPRRERKGVHERASACRSCVRGRVECAVIAASERGDPRCPRDSRSDRVSDRDCRSRIAIDRSHARREWRSPPSAASAGSAGVAAVPWTCSAGGLRATRSSGGAQETVKIHRRPEMSESQGQCCCRGRNARDATRATPPHLGRVRRVHAPSAAEGWLRGEGRVLTVV